MAQVCPAEAVEISAGVDGDWAEDMLIVAGRCLPDALAEIAAFVRAIALGGWRDWLLADGAKAH